MTQEILKKIIENDSIIVLKHIRPDGDCYGSSFGLKYFIEDNFKNKKVYIPGEISKKFEFIGDVEEISQEIVNDSLVIAVDTATYDRLSFDKNLEIDVDIKIDHHTTNDLYGKINWIDTESVATCAMVADFFMELNDEYIISKKTATAVYTGILTDSNNFLNDRVNSKLFELASFLISKGVSPRELGLKIGEKNLNSFKFNIELQSNIKITENGLLYVYAKEELISKYNLTLEEAANSVNLFSNIEGVEIWALFLDYPGNIIRGRIRSKQYSIIEIAQKYAGGGHKLATGVTLNNEKEIEMLAADLDKLIELA